MFGKFILLSVEGKKCNNTQRVPKIIRVQVTFTRMQQSSME